MTPDRGHPTTPSVRLMLIVGPRTDTFLLVPFTTDSGGADV